MRTISTAQPQGLLFHFRPPSQLMETLVNLGVSADLGAHTGILSSKAPQPVNSLTGDLFMHTTLSHWHGNRSSCAC